MRRGAIAVTTALLTLSCGAFVFPGRALIAAGEHWVYS
jgi:hypothetical protein